MNYFGSVFKSVWHACPMKLSNQLFLRNAFCQIMHRDPLYWTRSQRHDDIWVLWLYSSNTANRICFLPFIILSTIRRESYVLLMLYIFENKLFANHRQNPWQLMANQDPIWGGGGRGLDCQIANALCCNILRPNHSYISLLGERVQLSLKDIWTKSWICISLLYEKI